MSDRTREDARTPEEISELRRHNQKQDDRIGEIEKDIRDIKTTLIGIDGKNGMRSQLSQINAKLERLERRPWTWALEVSGIMGGAGVLIFMIYQAITGG